MNIMNVGFNTLTDIGFNYSVRLNDEEILIYEEEKTTAKPTPQEKQLKDDEEKKVQEAKQNLALDELSPDEERLVNELQARDSEVKAHEAAHQSAGGGMTGAASYTYQQGPDGKMYAIGGEVSISMSSGSSPEEAIANARQVAAAAMAAGDPSPQDYAVAASARVMEMKAQQQIAKEEQQEVLGTNTYNDISNQDGNIKKKEEQHSPIDISA